MGLLGLIFLWLTPLACSHHNEERGDRYWASKTMETVSNVFGIHFTNGFRNVRASGAKTFHLMDASMTEYFALQETRATFVDELRAKFREHSLKAGASGRLHYVENLDISGLKPETRTLKVAPWWNPAQNGSCTFVQLATNHSEARWVLAMYAFPKDTNALVYMHVRISK